MTGEPDKVELQPVSDACELCYLTVVYVHRRRLVVKKDCDASDREWERASDVESEQHTRKLALNTV